MKKPKERVIYDNYDSIDMYNEVRVYLEENSDEQIKPITEEDIWTEIDFLMRETWSDELDRLKSWFAGCELLVMGNAGRWDGCYTAGDVFEDFETAFYKMTTDCIYWKIWDENGHLYLKCTHHDGNNFFEVKCLTEKGSDILETWEYDYNDKRSEEQIHNNIWNCNIYSRLPHFAHNIYGCRKKEYLKKFETEATA